MTEAKLGNALRRNGIAFELNPGEGAFYGPKIEIYVPDALKRKWQLATIQLDYNMPERFGLTLHHQRRQRGAPGDDPSRDPRARSNASSAC